MNRKLLTIYDQWYEKTGDARAAAAMASLEVRFRKAQDHPPAPKSEWLTIAQAAAEFNISERSLYKLKELHKRNGKSVRIRRSQLAAHLEGQESLFG